MKFTRIAAVLCATTIVISALPAAAQVAGALQRNPQPSVSKNEREAIVCFYGQEDFKFRRHCARGEGALKRIRGDWSGEVKSITVENARVKVCNEENLRGDCEYIGSDRKLLPETVLDNIQSYDVL